MRIAIEGNIGSGKSTVLKHLAAVFPDAALMPEPVDEWADILPLFYQKPSEWALAFSLRVLLSFTRAKNVTPDAVAIVERSPLANRHVFTQLLYNDATLTREEWELFKEFHDEIGWAPDLVVFLDCPSEECLARTQARARPGEETIDIQFIKRVEFQYENMLRYCPCPVVRINGSGTSPEVAEAVARAITESIAKA